MRKYYIWYIGKQVEVSASLVHEYLDILISTTTMSEARNNRYTYILDRMDNNPGEEIKQKYEMLCKILRTKLREEE